MVTRHAECPAATIMSRFILECAGGQMMTESSSRVIAVTGATGLQGGAVARRLLEEGWRVRALTRNPERKKVRSVAALGAEIMRADMDAPRRSSARSMVYLASTVSRTITSAAMTGSWHRAAT